MNIVKSTEAVRPPIMAWAMGAYCSAPVPSLSAIGIMPMMVASDVIRMGRRRTRHDVITASLTLKPSLTQPVSEIDDQNAVRRRDSDQHQHAHEGHHIQGRAGNDQNYKYSDQAHGNGKHDQQGIDE